jgi:Putative Flp pilus-assembly TadE/G-like
MAAGNGCRTARRGRGDRGSVLVLFGVAMVGLLVMAGLVIDIASLRHDRSADRAAADAAALAGVAELNQDPIAGVPTGAVACQNVWSYFLQNRPDATPVISAPSCNTFATACLGVARDAVGRAGPYTVTIRYPVPDNDPMMDSEAVGGDTAQVLDEIDGLPCGRIGVGVVRTRTLAFGQAFGLGASTTDVHSVAVATTSSEARYPINLLILDRTGCGALIASGGGQVLVRAAGTNPGYISVDTDASQCSGGNYGTDAQGAGSQILAEGLTAGSPGIISLYGLRQSLCNATDHACDSADVAAQTLKPLPTPISRRTGRTQVDWRYNCKPDYGAMLQRPCPLAPGRQAYIDALRSAVGTTGMPAGYQNYAATYPCSIGPGTTVTVPQGNWWVSCSLDVKGTLTFNGGNLVLDNSIKVGSAGTFKMNVANTGSLGLTCQTTVCITTSSANHAFAYIRSGGIERVAGGNLTFDNTFVYLANGTTSLTGGSGSLTWTAPGTNRTAANGPFEDLALWSESTAAHGMSGGSALTIDGIFFTPKAEFTYTGSGSQVQAKAQFITWRLKVTGSGRLVMAPDPDRAIEFPLSVQRLIR